MPVVLDFEFIVLASVILLCFVGIGLCQCCFWLWERFSRRSSHGGRKRIMIARNVLLVLSAVCMLVHFGWLSWQEHVLSGLPPIMLERNVQLHGESPQDVRGTLSQGVILYPLSMDDRYNGNIFDPNLYKIFLSIGGNVNLIEHYDINKEALRLESEHGKSFTILIGD